MQLHDFGGIYRFSSSSSRKGGIAVATPRIQMLMGEPGLRGILASSDAFPFAFHVRTRDTPTKNYPIPLKNAEHIFNMGRWMEDNTGRTLSQRSFSMKR